MITFSLTTPGLYYRHIPGAGFLEHQFAVAIQRPETEPVFTGKAVTGLQRTGKMIPSFKLVGWGETKTKAMIMAKGAK